MRMLRLVAVCFAFVTLAASQQITGSISGLVQDPTGAPVAAAKVTLTNTGSGVKIQVDSSDIGTFEFLSVVPGTYDVEVEARGFKKLQQTGLRLVANQRLSTGPLSLELGNVTESVQVTGRVDAVQTVSAERSSNISRDQIDRLQTMARDPLELVLRLPGVLSPGGTTAAVQLPQTLREFSVNGSRGNNKNFLVDGVNAVNTVTNQAASITPNMDSVEEIQVQLANYQAEFGRSAGPAINLITRSGTREFHGSAYFYLRNEVLNAKDFFQNKNNQPKPRYRNRTQGFTIGGPAYWPGKFNTEKNKLFFFFAYSGQPFILPAPLHQLQMPTQLERNGDFSQTVNQAGARINVIDPTTGAAFPNNTIPGNRLNAFGQQILNFFPLPNTTDPTGARRFNFQKVGLEYRQPRTEETVKIDYNLSSKYTFTGRYIQDSNDIITDYASNFSITNTRLYRPGKNLSFRATQILSPRMTNEATFGYNRLGGNTTPETTADLAKLQREPNGVRLAQLNPSNNPDGVMPLVTFGAIVSGLTAPTLMGVFGLQTIQNTSFTDNLARIHGTHTFKFGFFVEKTHTKDLAGANLTPFAGSLNFAVDPVNPGNTGYPYANAVLGNFSFYDEATRRNNNRFRFTNWEFYAQDNWRVNRKLTLDYGLRFYLHQRESEANGNMANFDLTKFDPARTVRLYRPFRQGTTIVAQDPGTGTIVPRTLTGAIVPGSGNVANGMVVESDSGAPKGLIPGSGLALGPRFGFAYDPFGKGDTAIRGGFGVFYDRIAGANIQQVLGLNPPVVSTPRIYYGNLSTFASATGVLFPQNVSGYAQRDKLPTVMNFSLGVQRRVKNLFMVDVAYVGSLARGLIEQRDLNVTPFGTNFLRANENPTAANTALAANFLRPLQGYGAVNLLDFSSNSSYHSLQTQVQRRFSRLSIQGAWTWSKSMGYADGDRGQRTALLGRWRDYGKNVNFDLTHVVNLFWYYDVPEIGKRLGGNRFLGVVLDGWQLSGLLDFISGRPSGIGFQAPGADFTGSTEGGRINVTGNPVLPKDQRTFSRHFNTSAVARPTPGVFGTTTAAQVDYGNAARDLIRLPGLNDVKATVSKNFKLYETHTIRISGEFYNLFNHPSFRTVNTNAVFNAAGVQTSPTFGEYTGTFGARVIQIGLRYGF